MIVPGRKPHLEIGVGLEGYFEVELIDARTGLVKRRLEFHNVITDAGMNAIGEDSATKGETFLDQLVKNLAVGTGTATPTQSDTSLASEVERVNLDSQSRSSGPNFDYWELITQYEFGKAEANANLTELGTFNDNAGGVMFTRQRFKDDQGSNTTITKTSDDILRVRYIIRLYPDKTVKTKDIDVDVRGTPTTTTFSYQPQQIDKTDGWDAFAEKFGGWQSPTAFWYEDNTLPGDFISNGPLDNSGGDEGSGGSQGAYSAGNFYVDYTLRAAPEEANFATGVGAVTWRPLDFLSVTTDLFLLTFDPKIDKTDQDELEVTVRLSWSRVAV